MDSGREYETHAESTHVYGTRMRAYMCHLPLALQSSLSELSTSTKVHPTAALSCSVRCPFTVSKKKELGLIRTPCFLILLDPFVVFIYWPSHILQTNPAIPIIPIDSISCKHSSPAFQPVSWKHQQWASGNHKQHHNHHKSNHYYRIYNWSSTTIGRTHVAWCHPCGRMRGAPCGKLCDFRPGS